MIKAIFVGATSKINQAINLRVNAVFTGHKKLKDDPIEELRENKIKVYAEFGLFGGEESWKKYPDSRPVDRDGNLIGKIHWYTGVCPNHPQVRRNRLQEIKLIIKKFNINGIWLDFIRYPCHWEVLNPDLTEYCFCPNCLEKFKKEVGGEPKGEKWIQWKCDQITNFVAEAHNLINQSTKKIQLGMFSVPWRERDFNGAIKKVIGQDFRSLAKYIDIFSPMVYHKMCGRTTDWIHEIVDYVDKMTDKPILPIIQTEDKPEKIPGAEFEEEIDEAIKKPSQGVIVFFLEDLLRDQNKIKVFKKIFK